MKPRCSSRPSRALDPNAQRAAEGRARHVRKRPPVARAHRALGGPLRNCFITVADRELMLPTSLTKRLVNHARPQNVTEGHAADWTMAQLRESVQRVAERIDALIGAAMPTPETSRSTG